MHQQVEVTLKLPSLWLPATWTEEEIGVYIRESIQLGFQDQTEHFATLPHGDYLDIIDIKEETAIYGNEPKEATKFTPLKTIEEIKAAIDAGKTVKCGNGSYSVIKDKLGQYFIKWDYSDYYIGLHGLEGTEGEHRLNGDNFYIQETN